MKQELLERLEKTERLPVVPVVAAQVLSIVDKPTTSLSDIADIIEKDPALSLRVMQMANSAFYGRSRSICAVLPALTLIGLKHAVPLVIALSAKSAMSESAGLAGRVDLDMYWRRAVLTSCLSSKLAAYVGVVSPEEALLAGLLQDIGVLVCAAAFPAAYPEKLDLFSVDHERLCDYEVNTFGSDHSQFGAWLLARWGLPAALVAAVRNSHETPLNKESSLHWCVAGAGCIANCLMHGMSAGNLRDHIRSALHFYWLRMDVDEVDEFTIELLDLVAVTESLFDADVISALESRVAGERLEKV